MKLCLLFHCLCESYDGLPAQAQELFVSLPDLRDLFDHLTSRGYRFASLDDPAPNTVSVTFDDGYYNNLLFKELSKDYDIPHVIFIPAYYPDSGEGFPWMTVDGNQYARMAQFDYYSHFSNTQASPPSRAPSDLDRAMTFEELAELCQDRRVELGCHGYYHQPLSQRFAEYVHPERDLALKALKENLGITPRYHALANGMYTKDVVRELLRSFERVFTIEGRPFSPRSRVIHRLSLINPNVGGHLIQQVDHSLKPLRQIKRALRSVNRLGIRPIGGNLSPVGREA